MSLETKDTNSLRLAARKHLKVGYGNMRTTFQISKTSEILKMMYNYGCEIVNISKSRLTGADKHPFKQEINDNRYADEAALNMTDCKDVTYQLTGNLSNTTTVSPILKISKEVNQTALH